MISRKVIDLFSGVGGLSLGAARAGLDIAAAVEIDAKAMAAHSVNFPTTKHLAKDVAELSGVELLHSAGIEAGSLFGLVGGPPCQGFSEIGLRSKADPRNGLFADFFRLVAETKPAFFLAENVPGLMHPKYSGILDAALERIPGNYVQLKPFLVTASSFGAPTSRKRIFFIGFDPSKIANLTEQTLTPTDIQDVRVRDALAGVPSIRSHWLLAEQGWRVVKDPGEGEFQSRLGGVIPVGVGNERAIQLYRQRRLVSGFLGTMHTDETVARFDALRHGEVDEISRARRLDPAGYCPTIRAGTGAERGSFQAVRPVHPGSPRVIAPREAARLQGFPDWFQFDDTKWHSFRQIGNSVSPIVAERLFKTIASAAS